MILCWKQEFTQTLLSQVWPMSFSKNTSKRSVGAWKTAVNVSANGRLSGVVAFICQRANLALVIAAVKKWKISLDFMIQIWSLKMGGDSSPVVICRYNQRGLCKYGERCKRQHIYEECNDDECKSILCTKRHPLLCNFYVQNGFCRFKERCAFAHRKTKAQNETQKLSIEVAKLKA